MVTGGRGLAERGGLNATLQGDSVRWQGEAHDGDHYCEALLLGVQMIKVL